MKFSATFLSLALLLAGSVEAASHVKRGHWRRTGPSAVYNEPTPVGPEGPGETPPTTPTQPTAGTGSGKRGLEYNDASLTHLFTSPQFTWAYNWDSLPYGSLPSGVTFFPMLWDDSSDHTSNWNANAAAAIAAGATHLLAFNEPDLGSQANMSPTQAAAAWRTYMEPFHGSATLVSPAVTNGGSPMGVAWMTAFLAACNDCHIDKIAIHIYDSATNIAYFQSYIQSVYSQFNKPIMLTEFGASGSTAQQQTFLTQMMTWLDSQSYVTHYAYFMVANGALVNGASLSPLGSTYNAQ